VARHELKTWPEYFEAVARGDKTFEVRKDDRGFMRGDLLVLCEIEPDDAPKGYTGRTCERRASYVLRGPGFGVEDGYCVMALENVR